jgi:uncharacterized repeat protein (TIGR01451 family)
VDLPFSHTIVDPSIIANGHKPKVIGDFAGNGQPGLGAESAGLGFKLYQPPDWTPHLITSYGNGASDEDAQVADVNNDGALDIVVGGEGGNTYWLENPRRQGKEPYHSTWQVHQIGFGRPSHDIIVGDVNGDGKIDVATESGIYLQGATPDNWIFVGRPYINRDLEGTALISLFNDGFLDLIAPYQGGTELAWFENPLHHGRDPVTNVWTPHVIDANPGFSGSGFPGYMTIAVADFNRDGRSDIAMCAMYDNGNLAWYEGPPSGSTNWIKHVIGPANYVHQGSLQVADFDGDGQPDLAFAEQEQSASKRIGIYFNGGGGSFWTLQVLANSGGHNAKAGVVGNDQHPSIWSANHGYFGAPNPLELWRNLGPSAPGPVAAISKSHSGNFTQGQTGASYSISVTNIGNASTSGTVSVSDNVPPGLTATSIAGAGWTCIQPAGPCTRSDALAPNTSYPVITVWVNVAGDAPASVTNLATVSGGGAPNNSASDLTTIGSVGSALGPISDNFNATELNTGRWTFVNPGGDGSYSLNGSHLLLSVPAGSNHDPVFGGVNYATRVVQSVSNGDFAVGVKFDSVPSLQYQFEGILVEQDSSNYLRLEFGSTGSSLIVHASRILSHNETPILASTVSGAAGSLWLTVQTQGPNWTLSWSTDGVTSSTLGPFTLGLTVTRIGPYVGNYHATTSSSPAFTASVDYFFNPANPVILP